MMDKQEKWYSGKLCKLGNENVDYRAEIEFDEYNQSHVTVYNIAREWSNKLHTGNYNSAVLELENGEYVSIFEFDYQTTYRVRDMVSVDCEFILILSSSNTIKGTKSFSREHRFSELSFEITDGHELIGSCPYDLNKGFSEMIKVQKIEIPIKLETICINTILGKFEFSAFPKYHFSKTSFSIGFSHNIVFKPRNPIAVEEFHEVLKKVTDLFLIFSGEIVTINKLSLAEDEENMYPNFYEFIGYCNFPKESLSALNKTGVDSTSFKRARLYKITDFPDLEFAFNYWFEHYDVLFNAQQAYGRILFDEEVKVVSENKFLAAMQMIEGYAQAYVDEEQELAEFYLQKQKIIEQLKEPSDKELVEHGLGLSGITFRKALENYLFEGINYFKQISKRSFHKNYKELINRIVNDRNFYTHSSNRTKAELSFDEAIQVSILCKEIYRIIILGKMGVSSELIHCRTEHNRNMVKLLFDLFGIEIKISNHLTMFDSDMWHFSNNN